MSIRIFLTPEQESALKMHKNTIISLPKQHCFFCGSVLSSHFLANLDNDISKTICMRVSKNFYMFYCFYILWENLRNNFYQESNRKKITIVLPLCLKINSFDFRHQQLLKSISTLQNFQSFFVTTILKNSNRIHARIFVNTTKGNVLEYRPSVAALVPFDYSPKEIRKRGNITSHATNPQRIPIKTNNRKRWLPLQTIMKNLIRIEI